MKIGILYTSHPDPATEPHPYHAVHARTTREVLEAEALGFDSIWIAEHHFSNKYGILPDPFSYLCYLAALTKRIKLCAGVMVVPLHHPMRIVENAAFIDILSNGRFQLGLGSGYRPYEFEGLGVDYEARRDMQEEAIPLILKGIATAEDAEIAVQHGVEVVYVSNHGGRQLDHGLGSAAVLPQVVAAVGDKAQVWVDGGFMRGTDVVKALALGAKTVGLGRLPCLGLAADGVQGMVRALELLEEEIRVTLALLGVKSIAELRPAHVTAAAPVVEPSVLSAFPFIGRDLSGPDPH